MRRSLSNVGGPASLWGDPALAKTLAYCLDVAPADTLPFTHGFHPYPARLHPETARRAIEAFRPTRVLDPFVGSGTVALESLRAGARFTGTDISPVAIEIAWTRTRAWPPDRCREIEREGVRIAKRAFHAPESDAPLPDWARGERDWYAPHTLREIVQLKELIDAVRDAELRRALACALSSVLVKLSKQASDSTTVMDRGFRPPPAKASFGHFGRRCTELTKMLLALSSDLHKRGIAPPEPDLRLADARTVALEPAACGLLLTSPPYPGVYDYALHHARRRPLLGDPLPEAEIGRRGGDPKAYRDDLAAALANALRALAPGGTALVLVGDGAGLKADRLLRDIAPVAAIASQDRHRPRHVREHLAAIRGTDRSVRDLREPNRSP